MIRFIRLLTLLAAIVLVAGPLGAQTTAAYSLIYSYNTTTDGLDTYGNLVQAPDANFWGATSRLGATTGGTLFKITPAGGFSVVYNLATGDNGYFTEDGLFLASDGNFYGTTFVGGAGSAGVIFQLTPQGVYTVLHAFNKATDGGSSFGSLVEGSDGALYGTTSAGGLSWGTIFKVTKTGVFTVLHTFTGMNADEASPYVGMIEGDDGNLYGVTNNDETGDTNYDYGSFFQITPSGTFTTLHEFLLNTEGGTPDAGLVEGPDGQFYGTTHQGGTNGKGTFYKVSKAGVLTVLHTFTGLAGDSGAPEGVLTLGADGNFYGTGTSPSTLYQFTPAGKITILKQMLVTATDGNDPLASPIFGADGNLYGPTDGGTNGYGAVYKAVLTPAVAAPVLLTTSSSTAALGSSFTLNWSVSNAFSNTARHCFATVQSNATGAGPWSGLQTGTVAGALWQGQSSISPTQSGTFTYALTCGGTESGFATVTVPAMTATAPKFTTATVGTPVSQSFTANGLSPYTWTVSSGSLPPGLSVSPSTGAITGTPSLAGTYTFSIQVQDSETIPATFTFPFTVTVSATAPTVIATPSVLSVVSPGNAANTLLSFSGFSSTAMTVSCAGLPANAACSTSAYSGSAGAGTETLSISTQGPPSTTGQWMQSRTTVVYALLLPGVLGIAFLRRRRSAIAGAGVLGVLLLGLSFGISGCASGPNLTTGYGTPRGTSTVTVTATAGSQTASTTITLTVN